MRILFLNAAVRGGAPRSVGTWARALREAGHVVAVASPDPADGAGTYWLPRSTWRGDLLEQASALNVLRLAQIIRSFRPDVVHTVQFGSHLIARAVAELFSVAWVHTVLGPLSPGQLFLGGPYIGASRAFAADARRSGASDVSVIAARLDLPGRIVSAPTDPPTVAFVSRLDGRLVSVARLVLEAFARVQAPARFLVAGDGDGLDALRRGAPGVEFLGHVQDIGRVHERASLLIGAGRTLIEALAAGVPCINVGLRGHGGVVDAASAGAIAAHNFGGRHVAEDQAPDPAPLAAGIDGLLNDPARLHALRDFGVRFAGRYDVRRAVPALEAVYERAVAHANTAGRLRESVALFAALAETKALRTVRRWSRRR